MNNDFLWVEKYAPKKIEDCILPEGIKKTFQDFVNQNILEYRLFYCF